MTSTDHKEEAARAFFAETLVGVAQRLRQRGVSFFAQGPEASAATWYVPGAGPELDAFDPSDVAARLEAHWRAQGLEELSGVAGALVRLAETQRPEEDPSGEVSPLIYVMF